jgi:hypothetical protein
MNNWKKHLSQKDFAQLQSKYTSSVREISHPEVSFDEDPIMKSLIWATDFKFCRNYSERIGCQIIELIDDYESYILKNGNSQLSYYELDKYIYTYFVNKIINEFPELIVKPKEPKSSRSIILPDYSAR